MNKSLIAPLKLGNGTEFPIGTNFDLSFDNGLLICSQAGVRKAKVRAANAKKYFGAPFTKEPSLSTLERWNDDGNCKTVTGKKVEPDGYGSDGAPSWLLALGMI